MLMYALIGLSLVLLGVVGLQFSYLFWIDRIYRERQKYLKDLEHRNAMLAERLGTAENRIAEQASMLENVYPELGIADEAWAEVIEER